MTRMTLKSAALELDEIRNNRQDNPDDLLGRVDFIGVWLNTQKNSPKVSKLLSEAHHLHRRIKFSSFSG